MFVTTSKPAIYAFGVYTGPCVWSGPGLGRPLPNSWTLGPAAHGDYVVVPSANLGLLIYSL
jgi:hypothetical protein